MDSPEVMQETANTATEQQTSHDENFVHDTLTAEQVREVVTDALGESNSQTNDALNNLSKDVELLGESVRTLQDTQSESANTETVYTVRADSSQVETAKACARIVCTEGLIVCLLLALVAGLNAWHILSGRWS